MAIEEQEAQLAAEKQQRDTNRRQGTGADDRRWRQADRLFAEALLVTEAERASFLDAACDGDVELSALVEELLASDGELDSFLEQPLAPRTDLDLLAGELSGNGGRIGPYRLLGQLGSGGMGTVYLARQDEPVERKVALKLIKPGMDSEQVLGRFEGERQALALMDHSNVARVYDAGSTDTGRSYFAMEYVPGCEITEHCDQAVLGFRDRVRLFLQVCDGVQHAHQKGLIHRDLKPGNIMVKSSLDEPATVKIIDFGVAKSLQRKLSSHAAHTQLGTFVGTPIYSSPEQIMGRFVETDTRSDIYSLGVVLYELLVGTPPHSLEDFEGKSQHEIAQMLSEQPPSTPIERFTTSIADPEKIAERRSLTVEQMQRRLRGDISWILLKCLERRPGDRYPSVSDLRKDLERWLEGLPLEARPSTGLYRLQKLVRRHRTAVTVTALVAATLLATTAAAVVGFLRAERAAEEAELAADFQASQLQEIDASAMGVGLRSKLVGEIRQRLGEKSLEPAVLEADMDKLESLLSTANFTDLSLSLLDEHIFERAEAAIENEYTEAPLLQARLWQSLADTRLRLGQYEGASKAQEQALEIRRRELGPEHPLAVESLRRRGWLRLKMGRLDDAETDLREATEVNRRVLGGRHPQTLSSISNLGILLHDQGKLEEAETYYREALETRRRVLGEQHRHTLTSINNMGVLLKAQGKLEEAETYYREALETRRRVLGEQHPRTLVSIANMGILLKARGKLEEAERYYREALETRRRILGDQHPHTLGSINNMGVLLETQGKLEEAELYYREALETGSRVLGDEHPNTLMRFNNLGGLLRDQGRLDEAEPYLRHALETRRRVLGDQHTHTLISVKNLAGLLNERSQHSEALGMMREALPAAAGALGENHPLTAEMRSLLGETLVGLGEYEQAETYLLEGHGALLATLPPGERLKLRPATERLARLYEAWGKPAQAAEWRSRLGLLAAPP